MYKQHTPKNISKDSRLPSRRKGEVRNDEKRKTIRNIGGGAFKPLI